MDDNEILTAVNAHLADSAELEQLLLSYFHRANQPANDLVLFGKGETPAVTLRYGSNGRPVSLEAGQTLRPEDRTELRRMIDEELLSPGPIQVARAVMFAGMPTAGFFRFADEIQIIPVPPEAPRPDFAVGEHPFLLEFAFPSSPNATVNGLRRGKRQREISLLLGLLLAPNIHGEPPSVKFHWVLDPIVDGEMGSSYRQGGYSWKGAQPAGESFADTEPYPPLKEVDPMTYYSRSGVGPGDTLEIPSSLANSLEHVGSLDPDDRERFFRAAYWYNQAIAMWIASRSIAFEAFVCAVEALMPQAQGQKACPECGRDRSHGPTRRFSDFVDRYVPELPKKDRTRFYSSRSAISHGGKLLHADQVALGMMGPQGIGEFNDIRSLGTIVRAVLINWLHEPKRQSESASEIAE